MNEEGRNELQKTRRKKGTSKHYLESHTINTTSGYNPVKVTPWDINQHLITASISETVEKVF